MTDDLYLAHLKRALEEPGESIILITLDGRGGLCAQTRCERPADLVQAARTLLSQAEDILDSRSMTVDEQDGDDDLLEAVRSALEELPDPDADEDTD